MNYDHARSGDVDEPAVAAAFPLDDRMTALLAGMRECACGIDRDWRILWANEQAAKQVGVELDAAIGRSLWSLFPVATGSVLEALLRRTLGERRPQWADYLSPITGRWVEMRVFPTEEGLVLVWSDLTERQEEARTQRRNAAERDAALAQLQAVLDLLPVGVGIAQDREARVIRSNPALSRMLSADRGDNAARGSADIDTRPRHTVLRDGKPLTDAELPIQEAARTGRPVPTAEYTVIRGDGSRIVITGAALPLIDAHGRSVGAVGCFTDISSLEAALSAVEAHAAFLSALGDTVPGLLWASDTDERIEYANRALEIYFGRPAAELQLGMWWAASHPDHAGAVEAAWARARETGEPLELEYPVRRHDGEHRWFLVRATPHAEGRLRRWIGIAVDVTERKRGEEQLRDTQRLQAVGKLAGGVAHEVNNQMTVVLGMAALAAKRLGIDHPARRAIDHITSAGTRAASITRQLLAFSRRQILQPVLLDLNDVLLAFQPVLERIVGAHTVVVLDLAPGRLAVRADRGQLEQVLVNLASNSRDAMPGGGRLTVSTALVTDADVRRAVGDATARPGPWIALSIADTGTGMSREVRARAFEPFFTTRPHGEGSGLGLATVYGIVAQSGGHLSLDSEPGAGTTVEVFLPAADGLVEEEPGPLVVQAPPARRAPPHTGRVVVAEDEEGVREMVREVLTHAGFDVLVAGSGDQALRMVAELSEAPALLVTDVVMPGMDGRELAARVRARWAVPVLYVSGYAFEEVVRRGLLDQQGPFLQKPFLPDALLEQVRAVVGPNRA